MARMHSRKHGKSGSKKPVKKSLPVWLSYRPQEAELLIAKLAKEEKTSYEIVKKQTADALTSVF